MKALARLPPTQGIAAMNSINVFAVTPLFMTAVFGTAGGCLTVAVSALFRWQEPVPRNNALATVDPASADGTRLWNSYVIAWTAWNHVRTVTALVASELLTIGFCLSQGAR